MTKRLAALITLQATMFGVIVGFNSLSGGSVADYLKSVRIEIAGAVVLYFVVPPLLLILVSAAASIVSSGISRMRGFLSYRRARSRIGVEVDERAVSREITQAGDNGLIPAGEAREMERAVRGLQPLQLHLIDFLDSPLQWMEKRGINYPEKRIRTRIQLLHYHFRHLENRALNYEALLEQLTMRGVIKTTTSEFHRETTQEQLMERVTTEFGRKLAYIIRKIKN